MTGNISLINQNYKMCTEKDKNNMRKDSLEEKLAETRRGDLSRRNSCR